MNQKLTFIVFISVFSIFMMAGCFYLGRRVLWMFPNLQNHKQYIYLTLLLFILTQTLGPLWYRMNPLEAGDRPFVTQWLTYISLGFVASVFFYFLGAEILTFVAKKLFLSQSPAEQIENLERRLFFGVGLFSLASAAIGTRTALNGPEIEEVTIPIKNLPEAFDGFRLVQISDLHVGPTINRDYAADVVKKCMDLKPDVIVLTGDMVDGQTHVLRSQVEPLKELKAPYGVFYCTGNHEYYWGAQAWCDEFAQMGFEVLLNQNKILEKNGSQLCVGGITDLKAHQFLQEHQADAKKTFAGIPRDMFKILLAHQPASYKMAIEEGVHLQLSGHTHGGQFFPWSLFVALVQKFNRGLYFHENLWVYTNRGTGYWGPPQRFTIPSEITHIRLKKGV